MRNLDIGVISINFGSSGGSACTADKIRFDLVASGCWAVVNAQIQTKSVLLAQELNTASQPVLLQRLNEGLPVPVWRMSVLSETCGSVQGRCCVFYKIDAWHLAWHYSRIFDFRRCAVAVLQHRELSLSVPFASLHATKKSEGPNTEHMQATGGFLNIFESVSGICCSALMQFPRSVQKTSGRRTWQAVTATATPNTTAQYLVSDPSIPTSAGRNEAIDHLFAAAAANTPLAIVNQSTLNILQMFAPQINALTKKEAQTRYLNHNPVSVTLRFQDLPLRPSPIPFAAVGPFSDSMFYCSSGHAHSHAAVAAAIAREDSAGFYIQDELDARYTALHFPTPANGTVRAQLSFDFECPNPGHVHVGTPQVISRVFVTAEFVFDSNGVLESIDDIVVLPRDPANAERVLGDARIRPSQFTVDDVYPTAVAVI